VTRYGRERLGFRIASASGNTGNSEHLSGALRLLGELATDADNPSANTSLKPETTEAVAALTERLRALSPRANLKRMHASASPKARRKAR
jgi:hypothetical protein